MTTKEKDDKRNTWERSGERNVDSRFQIQLEEQHNTQVVGDMTSVPYMLERKQQDVRRQNEAQAYHKP